MNPLHVHILNAEDKGALPRKPGVFRSWPRVFMWLAILTACWAILIALSYALLHFLLWSSP